MTPEELRALADAATPGPWEVDAHDDSLDVRGPEHAAATIWIHLAGPMTMGEDAVPEVKARALADARLIALAPDLAEQCAGLGEALEWIERFAIEHTQVHTEFSNILLHARTALVSLAKLEPR